MLVEGTQRVLGAMCIPGLITPTRGCFRAEATVTVPATGPDGEDRSEQPYRPGRPEPGSSLHLWRGLDITAEQEWTVHRPDGERIQRDGQRLTLELGGSRRVQNLSDDPGDPVPWSFWTEDWMAELLEPSRLLGLIDRITALHEEDADLIRISALPHHRLPSPYNGAADTHISSLDLTAEAHSGRIREILAHHADSSVDHYRLLESRETAEESPVYTQG
ncbi:hypothetical protein [Salinactinospora qingdaonensis]|uniref:Uncharacterized protein n=1 Tax=Salinactinospora qingdaonensis TaxID=702744 RepID=A0ABP7GAU1_9ACTN